MGGVARVGRGRGREAGGARQRLPSLDWSQAPPRGAPCARVGAARRKRKHARPACPRGHRGALRAPPRSPGSLACALPRSPGSPACAPSKSPGSPKCAPPRSPGSPARAPTPATWNPSVCAHRSPDSSRAHPAGISARSPPRLRGAARPPFPAWARCAPSPDRRGRRDFGRGHCKDSPGTCPPPFTSSSPWAGAEAAAAERTLPAPPHADPAAPSRWVLGSLVGPPVAGCTGCSRSGAACPRTQAGRGARAAGPPTSPWLARSHCVHSTPQCLQMRVTRVQGYGCHIPRTCKKNTGVHTGPWMGPLPPKGLAILLWLAFQVAGVFQEEVPISMNGLGNSNKEWQRFKLLLMSIQCVCQHLGVVAVRHQELD